MIEPGASVKELEARLSKSWSNLERARQESNDMRARLGAALVDLDSEDTSIVVSGSLARGEFTSGSDIDWTLLVDGQADPTHHELVRTVREKVKSIESKPPGREGTFGSMVFSHGLVHEIGGEDDTNRNTTQRLLLLLESCAVGREDAHRRVVRSILDRYLLEDRGLWKAPPYRIPRFLQNDFARYWRTMAVDFAYKLRKRDWEGWAIRNIKLRMSRKLIYASGLIACYRCHLDYSDRERELLFTNSDRKKEVVEHIGSVFRDAPLDIIAEILLRHPHLDGAGRKIFDSYDRFIEMLANEEQRSHLEELTESQADTDGLYREMRDVSHGFRDGVQELFFDEQSGLADMTKSYGVF